MTPEETTATPAPQPNEPGSTPSPLNKAQLASLTKTEEIYRTALKADYLLALITLEDGEEPREDEVSKAAITAVLALCEAARGKGSAAVSATGHKQQSTAEEEKAEKILVAMVREFQARARQKHFSKNPDSLVEQATERRMCLQFAADAEWPHTDPTNTPIRREFQLPANRAFIG